MWGCQSSKIVNLVVKLITKINFNLIQKRNLIFGFIIETKLKQKIKDQIVWRSYRGLTSLLTS
jgi:hypothetical protein